MTAQRIQSCFKRFRTDERGVIALTLAIMLIPLMTAIGGAMDMGNSMKARQKTQSAIDLAANSAVVALRSGATDQEVEAAARTVIDTHYGTDQTVANIYEIKVHRKKRNVEISARGSTKTTFLRIIGIREMKFREHTRKYHEPIRVSIGSGLENTSKNLTSTQQEVMDLVRAIQAGDTSRIGELRTLLDLVATKR